MRASRTEEIDASRLPLDERASLHEELVDMGFGITPPEDEDAPRDPLDAFASTPSRAYKVRVGEGRRRRRR